MNAILIFTIATFINVTLSTIRSLCTIKAGKWVSAITNAICYGFYPLIVMLTAKDTVSIAVNMAITACANFICVWIIKYVEEKARKDKLWCVQATIPIEVAEKVKHDLRANCLPHNYIDIEKYYLFNVYCENQEQSKATKVILDYYNAKYFVSENKTL